MNFRRENSVSDLGQGRENASFSLAKSGLDFAFGQHGVHNIAADGLCQ